MAKYMKKESNSRTATIFYTLKSQCVINVGMVSPKKRKTKKIEINRI